MLQLLEHRYLANSSARDAFIFVLKPDLLQGDELVGEPVASLVDDAVRALADLELLLVLVKRRFRHFRE